MPLGHERVPRNGARQGVAWRGPETGVEILSAPVLFSQEETSGDCESVPGSGLAPILQTGGARNFQATFRLRF